MWSVQRPRLDSILERAGQVSCGLHNVQGWTPYWRERDKSHVVCTTSKAGLHIGESGTSLMWSAQRPRMDSILESGTSLMWSVQRPRLDSILERASHSSLPPTPDGIVSCDCCGRGGS